jgi:hypothetical protein
MASLNRFEPIVEKVLCDVAHMYRGSDAVRTLFAFDREHGQFLLIDEGWEGIRRVHSAWAHVEVTEERVLIHEDGTEVGIASLLMRAGIPQDRIVLAFYPPEHRVLTDFAVA